MTMRNHTSWGRTRSPKNLAGSPGTAVLVAANTNNMLGSASGYKEFGYSTENQRYLHVLVTDANSSDSLTVTVYGYCHAFERWFEIPETEAGGEGQNTANAAASITVGDSNTAESSQTPAHREYRVYEILGIDRVAFVGTEADVNVYAACSTF